MRQRARHYRSRCNNGFLVNRNRGPDKALGAHPGPVFDSDGAIAQCEVIGFIVMVAPAEKDPL